MFEETGKTIGERLKEARLNAGYSSAAKAAARVGQSESTFRAHENGQNLYNHVHAQTYAAAFGVSAEWLLFGGSLDYKAWKAGRSGDNVSSPTPVPLNAPSEQTSGEPSYHLVPEYNACVSAGGGAENGHERVVAQWPFQPNYIRNYLGLYHADLAIVEVRGDSMEPTLLSGDRVLINISDKQISQSGIFVLYDGGGTVIKRIDKQVGNDETVTLISDNRIHPPYQVNLANLNVIGRVVWVARRL